MSVLIPALNHPKIVMFWGMTMMVAGWVYWQPPLEPSQQNRTMPRDSPLSCDKFIIMKNRLMMRLFQFQLIFCDIMLVCKLESLSNACVDPMAMQVARICR